MSRARCTFKVAGLDCAVEMEQLRAALGEAPGVLALGFDLIHGSMTVDYEPEATSPPQLLNRIATAGMNASLVEESVEGDGWWRRNGRWVATVGSGLALLVGVMLGSLSPGHPVFEKAAYLLAILFGGYELFPKAVRGLAKFRFDIHVLMTVAVAGALILGQWDEAATVAFLFGLSEALERFSLDRARRAVRRLLEIAPETAEVVTSDGTVRIVAASELKAGDRVHVRAGDRIPIDGAVVSGRSSVDQKAITGESVPVPREPGDPVFAGTVNGEGSLEVEAAGPIGNALISRIIAQVRDAQAARAPVERRIGRFAAIYTPVVMGIAALIMIAPPLVQIAMGTPPGSAEWGTWFGRGLVVLVIACPCALVISTPVAIVSGLTAAARRGILVKGGEYLEEFGQLRVLAFDKTGTLTRGEPDVVEVVSTDGSDGEEVLRIAAALGDRGGHVLGRAIARHARQRSLTVPLADGYRANPGLGASGLVDAVEYHIGSHRFIDEAGLCPPEFHDRLGSAERNAGTAVALSTQSGPLGWIRLADQARPEAARILAELNALGIQTVMLTGDNPPTAAAMAQELGIIEHRSGLLPAEKVTAITELDARHGSTGMVGDGVNDAPALATARVSVALGGISSGAALETADVVLMADDLNALPWLVRHSRKTLARIRQNIGLALGTKALVLLLAALGYATLAMAIAADLGTSLLVTANALRLLRNSSPDRQ
ncbi:heavy metal translocating P-type ATPase [Singulisphaera acidiphila]|uniref:P-type Zn(2+) transporter n=1 Tax=Singulisphaera acidiphila (strain ATCC BAA-1392 / DSM 18658 / VKM B-2454 / MOB10) TaxID=886293 RepID=L0DF84_SINAD|nr:heavy metal translocating P-type ATPase [Singulisphaera acidiphila]AGA27515.1 heavy metal translocating P-type ATPase [Singulisphaera acidiphila DSM 18658]